MNASGIPGCKRRLGLLGAGVGGALLISAAGARADVFYYKDAGGVFHFTNVPGPGRTPFISSKPFARAEVSNRPARPSRNVSSYDDLIAESANRFDVEPALIKAVIHAESNFNRLAVSRVGARGLMQLMPKTARSHGVKNVYDPRENIEGGVKHLRLLLDRFKNNIPRVLAAYNAGEDPVNRYRGIPPIEETRTYVARVLRYRQQYLKQERLAQVSRKS